MPYSDPDTEKPAMSDEASNSGEDGRKQTMKFLKVNDPTTTRWHAMGNKVSNVRKIGKTPGSKSRNKTQDELLSSSSEIKFFGPKKAKSEQREEVYLKFETESEEKARNEEEERRREERRDSHVHVRTASRATALTQEEEKELRKTHDYASDGLSTTSESKFFGPKRRKEVVPDDDLHQKVDKAKKKKKLKKLDEERQQEEGIQEEAESSMEVDETETKKRNDKTKRLKKLDEEEQQEEIQEEVESSMEVDETETRKRNDQEPDDIFGYPSMLSTLNKHIAQDDESSLVFGSGAKSESNETDVEDEKDMTWLNELSDEENDRKHLGNFEKRTKSSAVNSSWLFWWFIWLGGRMPFRFVKNSDSENSHGICEMKKGLCTYYAFTISTVFIIFLTIISTLNLILIIAEEEVKGEPHNQIEKLLFEKNKVTAMIFLSSLFLASVCSINTLIYGDSIAKYMTLWGKTLNEFNFNSSSGIMTVTIIYILWTILFFLLKVLLFCLQVSDPKPSPFIEGTHLLTAMVFRSFVPNVLIEISSAVQQDSKLGIHNSPQLWKYGAFIVCVNAYALYCSWNFVIMVVLCSIGIRNMAIEWNFRLRLILRQADINKTEHFLSNLAQSLNYQKMFEWHRKIVLLVQDHAKIFCTILAAFYLALAFVLAAECLDLAIYAVGQKDLTFSLNETAQPYDFEKGFGHFMYLCFHMSQTLGIFLFVSQFLAQTSFVVMDGLIPVIRHNYMSIISTHRRNFFMSLSMSFSARKPHLLGAGGIFSIDRPFILGFLAFFLYFFSVMIQTQHERILTFPILLECPPRTGQFCVNNKLATVKDVQDINKASDDMAELFFQYTRPRIDNDSCSGSPPTSRTFTNLPVPVFQKVVLIQIQGKEYAACCYDHGPFVLNLNLTLCNQKDQTEIDKNCKVDPNVKDKPPYGFADLEYGLRSCLRPSLGGFHSTSSRIVNCATIHRCLCGVHPRREIHQLSPNQIEVRCP